MKELLSNLDKIGSVDPLIDLDLATCERTGVQPSFVLNDVGIKTAIQKGIITTGVEILEKQIQPTTLDVRLKTLTQLEDAHKFYGRRCLNSRARTVRPYGQAEITLVEKILHVPEIKPRVILRSSMGFCGIGPSDSLLHQDEEDTTIRIANYSSNHIEINRGARIAQILFELPYECSKAYGELVSKLQTGMQIKHDDTLLAMREEGTHFLCEPFDFRAGHIMLTASSEAYRFQDVEPYNFKDRRNLPQPEQIDITHGYTPKSGEQIMVVANQKPCVSSQVAIHFLERIPLHLATTKREKLRARHAAKTTLINAGYYDPGYCWQTQKLGVYLAHIKNVEDEPTTDIRPGDLIGLGRVFYFANSVERAYGSASLGSQYHGKDRVA